MQERNRGLRLLGAICAAALLWGSGCAVSHVRPSPELPATARWVVLPIQNRSETPLAGERVESMVRTLLQARGLAALGQYPAGSPDEQDLAAEIDDNVRLDRAIRWARAEGYSYGITGSVEEWRYKDGADAEPAVAVSLRIIELTSDRVLWAATAARTGWGRSSASGTALNVLETLVDGVRVSP